jgi:hypothetical protein
MKQLVKISQKKYLTIFIVTLVTLSIAMLFDSLAVTMEEAKNQASNIGSDFTNSSYISSNIITEKNKQDTPGYITDNPEETRYFNNPSALNPSSPEIIEAQKETVGGQFMTETLQDPNRPKIAVSLNDPYLSKAKPEYVRLSPEYQEVMTMFTTNYSDCKPVTISSSESETRTCDDFDEMTGGICEVAEEVEVKAEHNYNCLRSRQTEGRICDRSLSIACDSNDRGINLVSKTITVGNTPDIASINWSYDNQFILIDTYCQAFPPTGSGSWYNILLAHGIVNFNIENISNIKIFYLRSVSNRYSNSRFTVTLNGISISNNQDLIPYLRNGINTIEVDYLNQALTGLSSNLSIEVRQNCINPREVWTEVCS